MCVIHSGVECKQLIIILDKLYIIVFPYALMVRLSDIEGDTSDLQTFINTLDASKQNYIVNAQVEGGQVVLGGLFLNKIDTKDNHRHRQSFYEAWGE